MASTTSCLLLLLLAGAFVSPGSTVPLDDDPPALSYEDFTIKDSKGNIVMHLDVDLPAAQRSLSSSTSCLTDTSDANMLECRTWSDGRKLTVSRTDTIPNCVLSEWFSSTGDASHCMDLGTAHWYGGGEEIPQKWPLEKYDNLNHAMVTMETANRGIQDPFWFNSEGKSVYVNPGAPLFVTINSAENPRKLCLITKGEAPYRARAGGYRSSMYVCNHGDAKAAFTAAVKNFLDKPTGYPDELMIKRPVWSTWARYKAAINDVIVREFATEIKSHGFTNSQFEIDDAWETCYGSKVVDTTRFADMKKLTDWLRSEGFRVTIWTHPFIQSDCVDTLKEASANGFLVSNASGVQTHWWNGAASIVDFTKPAAQDWFEKRHKDMAEKHGIDGFKFDAGETSWNPAMPVLNIAASDDEDYPNLITKMYVETCARFNSLSEVRSAYRSQKLPIFVRMIDKDSRWGDNNGLKSLVTTLLQMNMVGYSLVLPDMIGGNQYNGEVATQELFIRWLQANVFMPALQYALVPWDYGDKSNETIAISKKFNDLHEKYSDVIIAAMKKNVEDGTPVNPPIWWLDPTDETALKEDSEFLLGDSILAAPVLEQGALKRDVYLPKGKWTDGNTGEKHQGPKTIKDYPAPLNTLPWFIRDDGSGGSGTAAIAGRPLILAVSFALLYVVLAARN